MQTYPIFRERVLLRKLLVGDGSSANFQIKITTATAPFSSYLLAAPRVLLSWTSFLPKDTRDIDVKVQTARLLMLAYIRKPTMYIVLLELDSGEGDPSFSVHVIEVDLIMFLMFIRSTSSSFKDAFCETNHLATSKYRWRAFEANFFLLLDPENRKILAKISKLF